MAKNLQPTLSNLITDVDGILVGNSHNAHIKTGTTAVICSEPTIASCHIMGGAPGTRDTDLLSPDNTVEHVNAIVLSGGSAFGLDAAGGVQAALREKGVGFQVADQRVPIVPAAILFDLINGGNKNWGQYSPYRELGYEAAQRASKEFAIGTEGAGYGALTGGSLGTKQDQPLIGLKGGLGSASTRLESGITIGALVAVNALGSPVMGSSGHFWAAPFEQDAEFGGLGFPAPMPDDINRLSIKFRERLTPHSNTTIGVIATDALLSKAETKRLATVSHDGFARALWPVHTPLDGDAIFALATGTKGKPADLDEWINVCAIASSVMARAIARAVYNAQPSKNDLFACWQDRFGRGKATTND